MTSKLDQIAANINERQTERALEMYGAEKRDWSDLTPQEKADLLFRLRNQRRYEGLQNMWKPSDQGNVS